MDDSRSGMLGRLIAHTGWTIEALSELADQYPAVYRSMVREVEMIRARQMVASSTELS